MGTESCAVKITETDDGFRIDVTGKSLKEVKSSNPKFEMAVMKAIGCCDGETESGEECCPEEGKKE